MFRTRPRLVILLVVGLAAAALLRAANHPARAQRLDASPRFSPPIAPASGEGERAAAAIKVPEGFRVSLFAAEPMFANPVAIALDERGRVYVAETFRHGAGVTDNRSHMVWLDEDLAARTVEDRVAMFRKHLPDALPEYAKHHERVSLLVDNDGDGKADEATVFADGFNDIADGIGSGVLARKGDVYYACIPNLWMLHDKDGDGRADARRSLHHGYGVHVAFLGHDLHGLRFGPDGKLYFSVGDRALNVTTGDGRHVVNLDSGAVLRCEPDGSGLELFATGLRNPQELAFDKYGNLFTGDNNSDGGDRARIVHVVEGGDSGWRVGYQYLTSPVSRGPWNAERMWDQDNRAFPAFLVPPVANLASGPSGLSYEPGTAMPEPYRDHFFLVDFLGSKATSGVRSFALKPRGASFELTDSRQFAWGLAATDVDFGPDNAMYISDWVEGWDKPMKGRIYRVTSAAASPIAAEVKRLLAEGMESRGLDELAKLCAHPDMRVRQEAQFALAGKGAESIAVLTRLARGEGVKNPLARLHAVWGLGQVGRKEPGALAPVVALLSDADAEVRAQAAKVLGDARFATAAGALARSLADASPRVRFYAAIALGRIGRRESVGPIVQMVRDNDDRDAYLRHAGVMALSGINDREAIRAAAGDRSAAVRMVALLALRRAESPEVGRFLDDPEPRLVLEAARAVCDLPIPGALPRLAAILAKPGLPDPLLRRAINACYRLGRPEDARALADFAARTDAPAAQRAEVLNLLAGWAKPPGLDMITGLWRPLPARPAGPAAEALASRLDAVLGQGSDTLQRAAARAIGALGIKSAGPRLNMILADSRRPGSLRAEALKALGQLGAEGLAPAARQAVDDKDPAVRTEARRILAEVDPKAAVGVLERTLGRGSIGEQQAAFVTLAGIPVAEADAVLARWLDQLLARKASPEIQLELLEAAAKRSDGSVRERLDRYRKSLPADDPLAAFGDCLSGGNARRGARVFLDKTAVSCLRCHQVRRRGQNTGGQAGPELTDVGSRHDRRYLLESIVAPNKQVAQGFETRILATADGRTISGIVKADKGDALQLITAEGESLTVKKEDIEDEKRGNSAMPEDLVKLLTRRELRDLVEFLSSAKGEASLRGVFSRRAEDGDGGHEVAN